MTCPGERFADDLARRDEIEDAAEDAALEADAAYDRVFHGGNDAA